VIAQVNGPYVRTRPWKLWSRLVCYGLFEGRPLTARGRWINPLVFGHFAMEKRLPQLRCVDKPVFILGSGRSGTTALGIALSMHRDVCFLNEPKALWHAIHPSEDLIGSYSRGPARYRIGCEDATADTVVNAHRLFGACLLATCSRRVIDKYPELIFRVPFVKAIFPDAKFLFLVRNGWETCRSIEGWSGRLGVRLRGEVHDWWGANRRKWNLLVEQVVPEHADLAPYASEMRSWSRQADMAAVEWIVTMREGLSLLQRYPSDVLRVTYESLCADPQPVLSQIASFTGLAPDETFARFGRTALKVVVAQHRPFPIARAIAPAFRELMHTLGY
jgi:hypothetical protein